MRERGDAIEAFKTLNGFNQVDKNQWFEIESEEQTLTRRNMVINEDGVQQRWNKVLPNLEKNERDEQGGKETVSIHIFKNRSRKKIQERILKGSVFQKL